MTRQPVGSLIEEMRADPMLTTDEVAVRFGVCPVVVRRWRKRGLLDAAKPSGRLLFRESVVLAALGQRPLND